MKRPTERPRAEPLFEGFHLGEEEDVADGVGARQDHHQAVDADAKAACGRHAVLQSAEEILGGLDAVADEALRTGLRNQGGGYLNHNIYFEQLKPEAEAKKAPEGALLAQIEKQFGSVDKLKEELGALAASQFGSGWGWLGKRADGTLVTYKTANQDNCYSLKLDSTPILTLDVWEHAYYLKYKNLRADYLKALWNIIDWSVAEERYK